MATKKYINLNFDFALLVHIEPKFLKVFCPVPPGPGFLTIVMPTDDTAYSK
jgi:hypothetical protein